MKVLPVIQLSGPQERIDEFWTMFTTTIPDKAISYCWFEENVITFDNIKKCSNTIIKRLIDLIRSELVNYPDIREADQDQLSRHPRG